VAALLVAALLFTAARFPVSSEKLRQRVVSTLADRLDAEVELADLAVRVYPKPSAVGTGLTIRHHARRDVPPLVSVKRFTIDADLPGVWRKRVTRVNLEGLEIQIPPRDRDKQASAGQDVRRDREPHTSMRELVVAEVVADEARLVILPRDAGKNPKVWAMHRLHVQSVGFDQKMPFRTVLTNAVPPGEIEATGTFGPWQADEPGGTPLSGDFTFDRADLGVFRGISGILSASGTYGGTLDTIDVRGRTSTPDFTVTVGGHPVPLTTRYHAIVDGTNGNTALQRIDATFLNTSLVATGGVFGVEGIKGRIITLDVAMDNGRLEDVMRLAVNTDGPPMLGALSLRTKFELPPGKQDVVEKLRLDGRFVIESGRFGNAEVQQRINDLSRRARGNVGKDQPAARVTSDFAGRFGLNAGTLSIQKVTFNVPGAVVDMSGQYELRSGALGFKGNLFLDAKLSQTTTGWKSLLLKVVDPIFRKSGRTVVPIKVGGTRHAPSFGLDVGRVFKDSS
jgi:hypothetical protein